VRESAGTGARKDQSRTGRVWAAGFLHVTVHSLLARDLKLTNLYLFNFHFFSDRDKLQITETTDTQSVDTGARLYFVIYVPILLFINTPGIIII
jgi:hypothetical protein